MSWEENFKRITKANQHSKRVIFETDEEKLQFIKRCESVYGTSTQVHLHQHKARDFEGNVDERKWYRFSCELMEKGYIFDDK